MEFIPKRVFFVVITLLLMVGCGKPAPEMSLEQKTFAYFGFGCMGIFVALVAWVFISDHRPLSPKNTALTLGFVLSGATTKYLLPQHDNFALASYFIGLVLGVVLHKRWSSPERFRDAPVQKVELASNPKVSASAE